MDYVVDARRGFYEAHLKFQIAYRDLLDAYVCAETLDKKVEELRSQLADSLAVLARQENKSDKNDVESTAATVAAAAAQLLRNQIDTIQSQRRSNNEDMRVRLHTLRSRTQTRQNVSAWFSELKVLFLRDEMPWLVELAKQSYKWAMEQEQLQQSRMYIFLGSSYVSYRLMS